VILIALGDVTGHGIGAALLMASARAALRSHARQPIDSGALLTRVNDVLAKDARHQKFMTMVLLELDPARGEARWASAGHDAPILYDPKADSFAELDGGDLPLAVAEGVEYAEYHRDGLVPGTVILVGTDGIWEAEDTSGKYYGKDRLRSLLRASHARSAAEIAAAIEADLKIHRGEKATRDDVTFVVIKVKA
jgi:sigma-B regulation protein RsbU (phosphoserine phosphatase)